MINIAIISPSKDAVSETFIKAHRQFINGNIYYLHGGYKPAYNEEGKIVNLEKKLPKIAKLLPFFLYTRIKQSNEEHLAVFFKKNKIQVILAEYGPTGCEILSVCQKLSIPLMVHFHGYDASKKTVLAAYKDKYEKLFSYASFIIVVSRALISFGRCGRSTLFRSQLRPFLKKK